MADPFIGEIRMFGGNFAPLGWMLCEGQLLEIATNDALFTLIGTTYGGNGTSHFALPDLRGRIPIHAGQGAGLSNRVLAETGGAESVTLTVNQIPAHSHPPQCQSGNGNQAGPANGVWAASTLNQYSNAGATGAMNPACILGSVGSQPHDNMMPFLCINFIIAIEGIFPPQN
jgi:microcystin-dependent protein